MLSTSSFKSPEDGVEWVTVPVAVGKRSFDEECQTELNEIFQHGVEQLRRHTADWQQTVQRMRSNFVRLLPGDAERPATAADDVVDSEKIRTLFFEYPPDTAACDDPASTSTRYQVRFDLSDCVTTSVTVTAELTAVVVRASTTSSGQRCAARVPLLPGVQRHRLRAFLSADGVLTVEAPVFEGEVDTQRTSVDDDENVDTGSKWKRMKMAMTTAGEKTSDVEKQRDDETTNANDDTVDGFCSKEADGSQAEGQSSAPAKEKVGVPIFRDELGTRRMYLAVELGTIYRPRHVIIQVIIPMTEYSDDKASGYSGNWQKGRGRAVQGWPGVDQV